MATYLMLADKARAFRADPEVQAAIAASRVLELAQPTIGSGRDSRPTCWPTTRHTRTSTPMHSPKPATRSWHLNQLAVEHALGAR
jgi:xylose isomerase